LADRTLAVPGVNQSEVDVYDLDTLKVIAHLKPESSKEKFGELMCSLWFLYSKLGKLLIDPKTPF
jgi:hypothetical protein